MDGPLKLFSQEEINQIRAEMERSYQEYGAKINAAYESGEIDYSKAVEQLDAFRKETYDTLHQHLGQDCDSDPLTGNPGVLNLQRFRSLPQLVDAAALLRGLSGD